MKNYICNSEKYICDKGYIYLPLKIVGSMPQTVVIEGDSLNLKSSFHVSLICIKDLLAKFKQENLENEIIKRFCAFVSDNEVSFVKFTGEFRLAVSEERKTIVARCEVSNLELFFKEVAKELEIDIPTQPTHVTLYTLQPDMGIGLNSFEILEQKSRIVDIPTEVKDGLRVS